MASVKVKQNKGRARALPKLKTILANPIKMKFLTLKEEEMQQLHELLLGDIKRSGLESRAFASTRHICIGLESSLRAINNCQSSCVFISRNIKPRHLIHLIARNAMVKDETVPVYVQPQLEKFTEAVFGVQALSLVLPKETQQLDKDLEKWVNTRKRPKKIRELLVRKSNAFKIKENNKIRVKVEVENKEAVASTPALPPASKSTEDKPWSGDFISFSKIADVIEYDKLKLEVDKDNLLSVLDKMTKNAKAPKINETLSNAMDIKEHHEIASAEETVSDGDDFLEVYKPLTVHKIHPNPEKKPKRKPKKSKNKKKSK